MPPSKAFVVPHSWGSCWDSWGQGRWQTNGNRSIVPSLLNNQPQAASLKCQPPPRWGWARGLWRWLREGNPWEAEGDLQEQLVSSSPPEADQFPRLSQVGILEAQGPQCLTEENAPEVSELCLKCILWAASPREMVCIDLSQLSFKGVHNWTCYYFQGTLLNIIS